MFLKYVIGSRTDKKRRVVFVDNNQTFGKYFDYFTKLHGQNKMSYGTTI